MNNGRNGIMLESYDREYGIMIEIKYTKTAADLDTKCEEALRQIKDEKPAEELLIPKNTVWAYGIAFAGKNCHIKT